MRLVFRGKPTQSRAELFEGYSRQFRRAADSVFAADEMPELADRLRANVSRFAAYKSAYVEGEFARIANDPKYNDATRKAAMNAAEDRFARWTDAEYNTATARCRTAKQMAEFMEPDNVRLFPNLEWLATRSANPRAEHQAFVGLILPKEHTFWRTHTPGTEWNCKCDLAETDAPASNADNLPDIKPPRGLEGNPYHTGEVFTDEVGYIKNARVSKKDVNYLGRDQIRAEYKNVDRRINSGIGDVLVDSLSYSELAQANPLEKAYWQKIEIAKNIDQYLNKLEFKKDETIDLSHNKRGTKAYKRKKGFVKMKKYLLPVGQNTFVVKMGEYANGDLMLYTMYQK